MRPFRSTRTTRTRGRRGRLLVLVTVAVSVAALALSGGTASAAGSGFRKPSPGKIKMDTLSSAARAWWLGVGAGVNPNLRPAAVTFGTNVDANDPNQDFGAGQSETAIAAAGNRVMAAWNDVSGFLFLPTTDPRGSATGVGFSADGGRHFTDLIGLANDNPQQQWIGDPAVVAVDGGNTFVLASLYYPSIAATCDAGPVQFQIAVEVATVGAAGQVTFSAPLVVASGGDLCPAEPAPDLSQPDKDWLSYDPASRTIALSYTRFFLGVGGQSGNGQVELLRAHVPADPRTLAAADFGTPIVVWPEEPLDENEGAYVSVAPGGDAYVGWERNWQTNLFNGDPYVYIHAAVVRAGATAPAAGGPDAPVVVTQGQQNSSPAGGVKSMAAVVIPGYSRGVGNDFPRVAVDAPLGRVVFVWNDASLHPLGDIFLRTLDLSLGSPGAIAKVNDDSSFALHFMPAVSVRANGAIVTSWFDRRRGGPNSTLTDYYAEVRARPGSSASDARITTGQTDWNGTGSLVNPNFGDYTDNTSTGNRTYFTWSDGRIGVPQPFVDRR